MRQSSRQSSRALLLAGVLGFGLISSDLGAQALTDREAAKAPQSRSEAAAEPNILLIYSDDTSFYTIGPYGDRLSRTPALDDLAEEGMVFTQAFSNAPFCKPSRNSLLSGLYPHEHGWFTNSVAVPAPAPQVFLPQVLAQGGYTIKGVGKWHSSFTEAEAGIPDFQPTSDEATVARLFLDSQAESSQPWFLYIAFDETHGPWDDHLQNFPNDWWPRNRTGRPIRPNVNAPRISKPAVQDLFEADGFEKLSRQNFDPFLPELPLMPYYNEAHALDKQVGRVLKKLEELDMVDNTLVIVTSDQGAMAGNHFLWYKGPALYEELIHVPLIVRWPERIAPHRHSDAYLTTVDLAPTILEAAGLPIPAAFTGSSLYPNLVNGQFERAKYIVTQLAMDDPASGQIRCLRTDEDQILNGQWKIVLYQDDLDELYDLVNDPYEINNLAQNPNYALVFSFLRAELLGWMADHDDPALTIFQ